MKIEIMSKKEIKKTWGFKPYNCGGFKIGSFNMDRKMLNKLKNSEGEPVFLGTISHSGGVYALKDGNYAIGMSNINLAGRGFVFTDLNSLKKAIKKAE